MRERRKSQKQFWNVTTTSGVTRSFLGANAQFLFSVRMGVSRGAAGAVTFFCSSLDFGRKTDVMTFEEPVFFLRSENISGPAGMVLNCPPPPFKFLGNPPC